MQHLYPQTVVSARYHNKNSTQPVGLVLIGYYTVLCTIWKYIVRVSIVLRGK